MGTHIVLEWLCGQMLAKKREFCILGTRFFISDFGSQIWNFRIWISGFEFQISDSFQMFDFRLRFRISDLSSRVLTLQLKLQLVKHIYECKLLNNENQPNLKYENIFNGQLTEQIEISRRFTHNMKIREEIKNDNLITPCDLSEIHCSNLNSNG